MTTIGLIPLQQLVSLQQDDDGNWIDAPEGETVVPLVKLPQPQVSAGQKVEPKLVWHEDRVERDWDIIDKTAEEIAAEARKIWLTVADFWAEFSDTEKLAIADSPIPGIRLLHEELRMWRGEVWSDEPKVQQGLGGLVAVGILTESRKSQILAK
jgi:hypothetical protein